MIIGVLGNAILSNALEGSMSSKTFALIAGILFLIMSLGHLLRLVLGFEVTFAGRPAPTWVSIVAVPVFGYLAYSGLRLARSGS
jgi:hypothetical protein